MNIEVVTTLNQQLKETGFGGAKAARDVFPVLEDLCENVTLSTCQTREELDAVADRQPDLVVLGVKYLQTAAEGQLWLSEYFEDKQIPYTGSTRRVLDFDSNKASAKILLRNNGVPTAEFFTAIPGQYKTEKDFPINLPLFLKPLNAANGNGVDADSFVTNFEDFNRKLLSLHRRFNCPILA